MNQKFTPINKKSPKIELVNNKHIIYRKIDNIFTLHASNYEEKENNQVISTTKKSLIITILLEGKLEFSYEGLTFNLNANSKAIGLVVNLTRPTSFRRKTQKQNYVSKIKLIIPTSWVNEQAEPDSKIRQFIKQNLASFIIVLTPEILELAFNIMQVKHIHTMLEKLNLDSLTQQLLHKIFEQIINNSEKISYKETTAYCNTTNNKNKLIQQSIENLLLYIEQHLSDNLTIKDLAKYSCMSESNLHRKFKDTLGYTAQSYIRYRRLEIAKQHIESNKTTVTEAAYNAGYKHPSNFTKAFKKEFGYIPSSMSNNN